MDTTIRIFLSYAREDADKVQRLYEQLKSIGYEPWMDKEDIYPGEHWETSIKKGIRRADFFVACISTCSIVKRGTIRKEINEALEIWKEKLVDDIYLIPVRLEECDAPEELGKFQWVDLFRENGIERLKKSIQEGMRRRSTSKPIAPLIDEIQEKPGSKIEVVASESVSVSQPSVSSLLRCPMCNTALRANARFCPTCGASIQLSAVPGDLDRSHANIRHQKMPVEMIGPYRVERLLRKDDNVYIVTPVDAPGAKGVRMNLLAIETARKWLRQTLPKIRALKPHQNILRFIGQLEDERRAQFLIVECPPGEPLDLIPAPVPSERALTIGLQLTTIVDYLHKHKFTFDLGQIEGAGDAPTRFQKAFLLDDQDHLYFFDYRVLVAMPPSFGDENKRIREDVLLILRTFLHFLTAKSIKHLIASDQADDRHLKFVLPNLLKHPPTNLKNLAEIFTQMMPSQEMPSAVSRRLSQTQQVLPSMQFAALTDIGRQLDHNEGNYLTLQTDPTNGLFVVADGMGEYVAGQVGSQVAVDELRQRATTEWAQLQNGVNSAIVRGVFHRWIKAANEKIYSAAQRQGNNMGATLTGALIINRHVYIANVGDSRTYLVRGGELYPLTWDHSRVASLVRAGLLEPDRIYDHPQRNEVFRALGQKSDVSIDVFDPVELALGDCVLACSDGLWKMVRPPQMKEIFARVVDPTACCAELVRTANQNGGEDNITVIIVRVV